MLGFSALSFSLSPAGLEGDSGGSRPARQWGWWQGGRRVPAAVEAAGLGRGEGAHGHDGAPARGRRGRRRPTRGRGRVSPKLHGRGCSGGVSVRPYHAAAGRWVEAAVHGAAGKSGL